MKVIIFIILTLIQIKYLVTKSNVEKKDIFKDLNIKTLYEIKATTKYFSNKNIQIKYSGVGVVDQV